MALLRYRQDDIWVTLLDMTNVSARLDRLEANDDAMQTVLDNILLAAHPVGSYYWSAVSTSPATLFGGTWTQITDRFVYASSSAGTTGGEATHTLTIAEMPSHTHPSTAPNLLQNHVTDTGGTNYGFITDGSWTDSGSAGGGAAHNNMPPYITAYCWRRTA